jgi:primary-amine oxidase
VWNVRAKVATQTINCQFDPHGEGMMMIAKPVEVKEESIIAWADFAKPGVRSDAWALLKQGLYLKIGINSLYALCFVQVRRAEWSAEIPKDNFDIGGVLGWYYNGILYNSTEAFRTAWKSSGFKTVPANLDGEWTDTEYFGPGLPGREKPPPAMIQPAGPRFDIDPKENFISWSASDLPCLITHTDFLFLVGFEFYLATSQVTAVSLFDIRFKGDGIMYEV